LNGTCATSVTSNRGGGRKEGEYESGEERKAREHDGNELVAVDLSSTVYLR